MSPTGPLLIVGSSGFAGSHLRAEAEAAGWQVVGASRGPGAGELRCDLLEPDSIAHALAEAEPAMVANLAGAASVAASFDDPRGALETNALGALNLLESAARVAPQAMLLFVSSGDAYGEVDRERLPIAEPEPLRPLSPYGASKAAMEVICGQYERSAGLRIAIARAFNHIGPGQSDRFAASSFARQVAEAERGGAEQVTLRVGNLDLERDLGDVRDTVRAYRLLLEGQLTGIYNVATGEATPLRELVAQLDAASPLSVATRVDGERLRRNEPAVVCGSRERLGAATGWEPRIGIAQSVSDLLDWWRERLAR